jgi:dTMP kinase
VSGVLIAFEGPEGSGKSTQARRLAERLAGAGWDVVLTREPGGTPIGERIRGIVLDPANCAMLAETEALLYSAARAQHVGEVIRPALERGAVVVCDRYVDSTLAYQGGGRGLAIDALRSIQTLATGGLEPNLRVLLDLPVEVGLARRLGSGDEVNRLDLAELDFHRRVRNAYRELAWADPDGWVTVDASVPAEDVTERIVRTVALRVGLDLPT